MPDGVWGGGINIYSRASFLRGEMEVARYSPKLILIRLNSRLKCTVCVRSFCVGSRLAGGGLGGLMLIFFWVSYLLCWLFFVEWFLWKLWLCGDRFCCRLTSVIDGNRSVMCISWICFVDFFNIMECLIIEANRHSLLNGLRKIIVKYWSFFLSLNFGDLLELVCSVRIKKDCIGFEKKTID